MFEVFKMGRGEGGTLLGQRSSTLPYFPSGAVWTATLPPLPGLPCTGNLLRLLLKRVITTVLMTQEMSCES